MVLLVLGGWGCGKRAPVGYLDLRSLDAMRDQVSLEEGRAVDHGGPVSGTWVTIPAGTFIMGSPPSEPCRYWDEERHPITLTHGFEMMTTEVTQAQFSAVMGYAPSAFTSCGSTCPVETVSWHEAVAYSNALSAMKELTACYTCTGSRGSVTCSEASTFSGQKIYSCPGYRLPTEAEWEYAYRAGTQTVFYNGANDPARCYTCSTADANADKIAWYCANAGSTTHPVGQKKANAWGLYDMAGNVWEWCHDLYQFHLGSSAVTDPWGAGGSSWRVDRGGSWGSSDADAQHLRAAARNSNTPTYRNNRIGFRCVRTLQP